MIDRRNRHRALLSRWHRFEIYWSMLASKCKLLLGHAAWKTRYYPHDLVPAAFRLARFTARAFVLRCNRGQIRRRRGYLIHTAVHVTGNNVGDVTLAQALRSAFDHVLGKQTWYLQPVWKRVTTQDVRSFNTDARGLVVGGHGLMTPDTMPHMPSGWQWNIDLAELRTLESPLVIFAVGYNRFRGQDDFVDRFIPHINETVRRSQFFGLRNTGSIEQVRRYLDPSLHERVLLQPCPTTVLTKHCHGYKPQLRDDGAKRVAINVALDRGHLRFGGGPASHERSVRGIAQVAKHLDQVGWDVHVAVHSHADAFIIPYLRELSVRFTPHWFSRSDPKFVIDFYTRMPLTLGMRGHAQMIPFGCGNMITPLITHDKLLYFLRDVGHPEWGVELKGDEAVDHIIHRVEAFDNDRKELLDEVRRVQDGFWELTKANISAIGTMLR